MAVYLEILEMERVVYEQFISHCYRFSSVSVVKLPTVWFIELLFYTEPCHLVGQVFFLFTLSESGEVPLL